MNKNTNHKKHRRRTIRKGILLAEVLLVSLVMLGGGRISGSIRRMNEEQTEYPQIIEKTTPEFLWENYKTVAHAMGALDEKTYLNSKESFINSYQKGIRLFEVDLVQTSDGIWVCRHSWNQSLGQWDGEQKKVLTEAEFLSAPLYGKYTPMSFKDLILLLKEYPDAFVLLDSKQYSVRNYLRTLEDYSEYVEIAQEADAEAVLDQLIPEIYNEAMFAGTALIHDFPSYIYSLWQEYSLKELEEIAVFCKEKGITAVTVSAGYWSEKVQEIFDKQGLKVYIYTVNDLQEAKHYMENGVDGVCSDVLLDSDFE